MNFEVKDIILNTLTMRDVLNKYGINVERSGMFHCPFHGEDKNASAKAYKDSFYCFTCNRTGDLIQFVQYLYNLNFQEAMNKIVEDFGLGIKTNGYYDKKKILEFEKQKQLKLQEQERKRLNFIKLCRRKDLYINLIRKWEKQISKDNWEDMTLAISYLQDRKELLEIYICDNYNIEY